MTYKYTFIIPHKNIPHLLERCINSIPNEKEIQIIIIDDNSTLSENEINKFPGINRSNIEVYFTKEGKGAGYARNIGLEHAKGKWIIFADADDMFLPDIKHVLKEVNEEIDILYFGICSKNSETLEKTNEDIGYNRILKEAIKEPITIKYKITNPWSKIYKKEIIDKYCIKFEEVRYANDVKFSTIYDFYTEHIKICPTTAYCYMYRPDSLWHQKSLQWATTRFDVFLNISHFFKKNEIKERYIYYNKEAYNLLDIIYRYSKKKYITYLFKYALHTQSVKLLLQFPIIIIHFLRIKLGYKKSILSRFLKKI